jgi:hypothetical protein
VKQLNRQIRHIDCIRKASHNRHGQGNKRNAFEAFLARSRCLRNRFESMAGGVPINDLPP